MLICIALSIPASAQIHWETLNPKFSAYELSSISFYDENNGAIVGRNGVVLTTTDGGDNWTPQVTWTNKWLIDVHFTSPDVGYVISKDGALFQTIDGGVSWTLILTGLADQLSTIHFYDSDRGIAFGGGGPEINGIKANVFLTTNSGSTWLPIAQYADTLLNASLIDANTIVAVGEDGTILRSTDSGNTWSRIQSNTAQTLHGVYFSDNLHGTIVGKAGTVLRSTDGGLTWVPKSSGITWDIRGVHFFDANHGVLAAWDGNILRTIDGGDSWAPQNSSSLDGFFDLTFNTPFSGFAIGIEGTVLRTLDSGLNWIRQDTTSRKDLMAVSFYNDQTGMVVGGDDPIDWPRSDPNGVIGLTSDGGTTWTFKDFGPKNLFSGAAVPKENTRIVVGKRLNTDNTFTSFLLRSFDGGITWTDSLAFTTQYGGRSPSLHFVNSDTGFINEIYGSDFNLKTVDGGRTWYPITVNTEIGAKLLNSMHFFDSDTGIAVSLSRTFHTTDGGETWDPIDIGYTSANFAMAFRNRQSGFIVGRRNVVLETTDGGYTWTSKPFTLNQRLMHIKFFDSQIGVAVGLDGGIVYTSDGGNTWEGVRIGTDNILMDIEFIDSTTILAVGHKGEILRSIFSIATPIEPTDRNIYTPENFMLKQNYPNPFNPTTTIRYGLPKAQRVTLVVYNLQGQKVRTLINFTQQANEHQAVWDGRNDSGEAVSSGVYVYRLTAGEFSESRKMVLLR